MHLAPQKEVAVLIFANSSQEELRNKSIPKSGHFFDALTEQTLATAKKTQFSYFHVTEKQQRGNSFGERFTNAIQSIFDKGFEHVITIGNDTPHLKASHIIDAYKQLAKGKSVLGPAADGGFYLMGLHRSRFEASKFKKLSWQTALLYREVSLLLSDEKNELAQLQTLFDLDDVNDLHLFFKRFKNIPRRLFDTICLLLEVVTENSSFLYIVLDDYFFKTFYNKGSPAALQA